MPENFVQASSALAGYTTKELKALPEEVRFAANIENNNVVGGFKHVLNWTSKHLGHDHPYHDEAVHKVKPTGNTIQAMYTFRYFREGQISALIPGHICKPIILIPPISFLDRGFWKAVCVSFWGAYICLEI